jgi:hypothetical protein
MEALVVSGDVRLDVWERYCDVYATVRAQLARRSGPRSPSA